MTPFIAQLILAAFNFPPKGFASPAGQLVSIAQNQALFALLGTVYGGNGQTNFALPNLQGKTPVGYNAAGGGFTLGQTGGEQAHTLSLNEAPTHIHPLQGTSSAAATPNPAGAVFATTSGNLTLYTAAGNGVGMNGASISNYGGSQPHENQQPYLVMNWYIALDGIFPSRN